MINLSSSPVASFTSEAAAPPRMKRKREEELPEPLEKRARTEDSSDTFYNPWMLPVELAECIVSNIGDFKKTVSLRLVCQAWLKIFPNAVRSIHLSHSSLKNGTLEKISSCFQNCSELSIDSNNIKGNDYYSDQILEEINSFKSLKKLDIVFLKINKDTFEKLSLSSIRSLSLCACQLTDAHCNRLKELRNLEELNVFANSQITGVSLEAIPTSIKRLTCSSGLLNDNDCTKLTRFTNLESLKLASYYSLSKMALEAIPTSLNMLDASNCSFQEDSFMALKRLINLTTLLADNTGNILKGLPESLKVLNISGCSLTNDSLAPLRDLTQLRNLNIKYNQKINGEGLQYLPDSLLLEGFRYNKHVISESDISDWQRLKK